MKSSCEAVKSAAEAIRARNQPTETTSGDVSGGRKKITTNFLNTILGLLEPLSEADQDYAYSQILSFVVALRQNKQCVGLKSI